MKNLYVIHTSPKRIRFVNDYMVPCFKRYGITDIIVWNDEHMKGQLSAWTECAAWIIANCNDYAGTWHLEDDVLPCKRFKALSEELAETRLITQGFTTNNQFTGFKGQTGLLPVKCLPYGMQCIYIPNFYLKGYLYFVGEYVKTGLYRKRQYRCGTLFSDNVFKGFLMRFCKNTTVNVLDYSMVEHVDYLIGGRSVRCKNTDRRARKFDNYEEVDLLKQWTEQEGLNGKTKEGDKSGAVRKAVRDSVHRE